MLLFFYFPPFIQTGPTPNTLVDFWSMVWQERVDQIVMLTNLKEGTRVNCAIFPDYTNTIMIRTTILHNLLLKVSNLVFYLFDRRSVTNIGQI